MTESKINKTIYRKLLWQNPSPTSQMGDQNINLLDNASKYDEIIVYFKSAHVYNGIHSTSAPYIDGGMLSLATPGGTTGEFSGQLNNYLRAVTMSAGTFHIWPAVDGYGGSYDNSNTLCIPIYIYGVQYGRKD